jgi:hypothetical protein
MVARLRILWLELPFWRLAGAEVGGPQPLVGLAVIIQIIEAT